jgi:hypothetical protein
MNKLDITSNSERVTSIDPKIFDPRVNPPPNGVEIMYFTIGGALVRGNITRSNIDSCMGWMAFPKMPAWLKLRIEEAG